MLIEKIKKDQIEARKSRHTVTATLLTTLIGEASMVAKNAQREVPTDDEVLAVVKKFLKGNQETQSALLKSDPENVGQARAIAKAEQTILESYLPKQLSEDELKKIVGDAIANGTPAAIASLMGFLKANHAGTYDGKLASAVIKAAIAS